MLTVYPDYYKDFHCIKGECRHNCCIGWEIDIDPDTAKKYKNDAGRLSERLKGCVSYEGEPHFILAEDGRCPFLNGDDLCDIIIEYGEDALCGTCAEHPRFYNRLPDRIEAGLGLCCEAAAHLILGRQSPMKLISEPGDDPILALRDSALGILQNRTLTVWERIDKMLGICFASPIDGDMGKWAEILLGLERMDDGWTDILTKVKEKHLSADHEGFDRYMSSRQTEYEQLAVYLIYRHLANAPDAESVTARASLAALGVKFIYTAGAVLFTENGKFDFEDQVELCRMFSSETEYSDENLYTLIDLYL